ncbi:MAG: DUF4982 domain-containing protein [Chitinispirillaceae bacterium]|nr:DUF4982 domain-containing protein [Chitinispirillaceae bacterium]
MRMVKCIAVGVIVSALSLSFAQTFPRKDLRFCDNWRFYRGDQIGAQAPTFNDASWATVCLPHTARIESAKSHTNWDYYKGYCWYRKSFTPDTAWRGKKIFLEVEAGMQTTQVWVNNTSKITYGGGYNPFTIDITGDITFGSTNVVAMRLNNAADPNVPPGAEQRDFYYYGGLYRYVNLHVMDSLHITDAVYANLPASGGIFVTYPTTSSVQVKTHVQNEFTTARTCALSTSLIDSGGSVVQTLSASQSIAAGGNYSFTQTFSVASPRLWSPMAPNLYTVRSQVLDGSRPADQVYTTIGIRRVAFSRTNGLQINGGAKIIARGVNRHQDYGAIGCAVPLSGHYRDALRLKEAGINFVRLSHYTQHPAFLDACDKLGITVQACMPGWQVQTYSNATWVANSERDLRTLIRYYRNHPCVVMWESVHNESAPPSAFTTQMHNAAHAEFPGDQMFTCGQESNHILDIWQAAVQQSGRTSQGNSKPQAISEYGHWEWGGFTYGGTSSNQPRAIGEAGMLTLASNQTSAMSQDHALSWLSVDAVWVYNETFGFTQYNNSLCGGGIVDVFRIPKFSFYFYQSQRETTTLQIPGAVVNSGPMVFIANFWTSSSPTTVRVYSNCEQVRLSRNGTVIATRTPDSYANIVHPPFTFSGVTFASGTLLAEGLIGGTVRATHTVRTPLTASRVSVTLDTATRPLLADGADLAIAYGSIVDANGTVMPTATSPVTFSVSGPGDIINGDPYSGDNATVTAVAGIATVYIQTRYSNPGTIIVTASASGLTPGSDTVRSIPVSNEYTAAFRSAVPRIAQAVPVFQRGNLLSIVLPAGGPDRALFRLYTLQGRQVGSWEVAADGKTIIAVSGFARGIYYGRLTGGNFEHIVKVAAVRQ